MIVPYLVVLYLTLPDFQAPWSFAVIGDTQENWRVVRKAVKAMRAARPDFVVHLGDVWNCASLRRWRETRRMFAGLRPRWVIGNHELRSCSSARNRPSRYRAMWRRHFAPLTWWSMKANGVTFIALDSATPDVSGHQLKWATREIGKAVAPVIIFSHRPLPWHNGKWYARMDPMPLRWRNAKLKRVLWENGRKILAVFHGHWHGYRRYYAGAFTAYCSGGGGGQLQKRQRLKPFGIAVHHWLLVTVVATDFWTAIHVERRDIK